MIRPSAVAPLAPLLSLVLASASTQAVAADLIEFTFGSGVGTPAAQTVAAHVGATLVVGRKSDGSVAPHSFVDLGGGNMAMALFKGGGGIRFDFTLTADPGHSFQITDAHFAFRTQDTAGVNRNISVWPNADPRVTWYDAAGGDTIFNDMGPGGFGWKSANWTAFVSRDDLQTLRVQLVLDGNSSSSLAIFDRVLLEGNVLAVPEPASALLLAAGLLSIGIVRRRRTAP